MPELLLVTAAFLLLTARSNLPVTAQPIQPPVLNVSNGSFALPLEPLPMGNASAEFDKCVTTPSDWLSEAGPAHQCTSIAHTLQAFLTKHHVPNAAFSGTQADFVGSTCDKASAVQLYCTFAPEVPIRTHSSYPKCKPVENPEKSAVCIQLWSMINVLGVVDDQKLSCFLSQARALAQTYCGNSTAPTCPRGGRPPTNVCPSPLVKETTAFKNNTVYSLLGAQLLNRIIVTTSEVFFTADVLKTLPISRTQLEYSVSSILAADIMGHHALTVPFEEAFEPRFFYLLGERTQCSPHCWLESFFKEQDVIKSLQNWGRASFCLEVLLPAVILLMAVAPRFRLVLTYPNRLLVYLVLAVLLFGLVFLTGFLEPLTGNSIGCNADNTTVSADEFRKNSLAQFSCAINNFGRDMHRFITFFVACAWWHSALRCQSDSKSKWYLHPINGLGEVIALGVAILYSSIMTGVKSRSPQHVTFISHVCFNTNTKSLQTSLIVLTSIGHVISLCAIIDGFRRLSSAYRLNQHILKAVPTKNEAILHKPSKTGSIQANAESTKKSLTSLKRLGVILFIFVVGNAIVDILTDFFLSNRLVSYVSYVECLIGTCGAEQLCAARKIALSKQFIAQYIVALACPTINTVMVCGAIASLFCSTSKKAIATLTYLPHRIRTRSKEPPHRPLEGQMTSSSLMASVSCPTTPLPAQPKEAALVEESEHSTPYYGDTPKKDNISSSPQQATTIAF